MKFVTEVVKKPRNWFLQDFTNRSMFSEKNKWENANKEGMELCDRSEKKDLYQRRRNYIHYQERRKERYISSLINN